MNIFDLLRAEAMNRQPQPTLWDRLGFLPQLADDETNGLAQLLGLRTQPQSSPGLMSLFTELARRRGMNTQTETAPPLTNAIAPIQTAAADPTPAQQFYAPARPTDVPTALPTRAPAFPNSPFIQGIDDPRIRASVAASIPAILPHPLATLDASAPTRPTRPTMPERGTLYYR